MEFKHLQSLTSVIRLNSFSKAAQELYISQPTISQHIQQLEDELKTRLIIRTTKSIEVTPMGHEVNEYAQRILALRDRITETCSVENSSVLHIGASSIPSGYILPEVLPEYIRSHPGIRLMIDQGDSRSIIEKLFKGTIDIGIVGIDPDDSHITSIPFCNDPIVLATPAREPFLAMQQLPETPLADLLKEPLILREEGSASRKAAENALESAGYRCEELHISSRINDLEAIRNLVAGGLGISILSERAVKKDRESGRILTFPFPSPGYTRKLYVIYRAEYHLRSYSRDLIRILKKKYL